MQTFGWLVHAREERHCTSSSPPDVFFFFLLLLFSSIQRPGSDESLQPIGCASICVVSAVIAGYTYPHHTTTTQLHGRLFLSFFLF
jgi:hypothetical protein